MIALTIQLLVFLLPLAYSPGPGNLFFASHGAQFGFKSTIPSNIGYHIATWIITALIGFGFGSVLEHVPYFFKITQYAGTAYILYLAWCLYNANSLHEQHQTVKPAGSWSGVMLLILNPKAYLIITAMFSQFLNDHNTHDYWMVLYITTLFTINNLIAMSLWCIAGQQLIAMFQSNKIATKINQTFATMLAIVAIWILVSSIGS